MTKVYNCRRSSIFTFNHDSLTRHNVTTDEIYQALADPAVLPVDEEPNRDDNPRVMWIGQTETNRLLEIGIEYIDGKFDFIYHANNAQAKYKQAYYQRNL